MGKPSKPYEFDKLARYNAEVARGIAHTPEWQLEMASEQRRFDEQQRMRLIDEGFTESPGGAWIKLAPTTGSGWRFWRWQR